MRKLLAYIGLIVAVTIWSLSFISIDLCLDYMTVNEVNILRFTFSTALLWTLYFLRRQKLNFKKWDIPRIAISGIFGTAAYYYFESIGLDYVSPSNVSIITAAIPMMTLVIAMLFMSKKTRFRNIFLIGISFVGIVILADPKSTEIQSNYIGIGIVLIANICWVIYTILNERLTHKYDLLNLLTLQVTFGTMTFYFLYGVQIQLGHVEFMDLTLIFDNGRLVMNLLFLSVLASVLAYHLYNYALRTVGVTLSALFINVIPVVTLLVSVSVGQETLSFSKIIGCLLVVLAVYLIEDV
jgi:drug/metabolite transporter (DMT)-like permease